MKYFVSCALPGKQLGLMQFEASSQAEMQETAEKLSPYKCFFRSYAIEEFDQGLPVGEFVSAAKAKELGY